jgi:hypothetical protein
MHGLFRENLPTQLLRKNTRRLGQGCELRRIAVLQVFWPAGIHFCHRSRLAVWFRKELSPAAAGPFLFRGLRLRDNMDDSISVHSRTA